MNDEVKASLISGAGNIASSAISAMSVGNANRMSRKIVQEQNKFNVEQRDYENAYNAPSAQMARLKAAGLNPNLVYGNGSAVTSSAQARQSSIPQYQAIDPGLDNGVNAAVNTYMQMKNYQLAKEQTVARTNLMQQQAQVAQQDAFNKSLQGLALGMKNSITRQTMPYQVESAKAQAARLAAGNVLLDDQHLLNLQQYDLRERAQLVREEQNSIAFQRLSLERDKVNLSNKEYQMRKTAIDNQERRARKTFNMNWQDWNAMRFGKYGGTYAKALEGILKIALK